MASSTMMDWLDWFLSVCGDEIEAWCSTITNTVRYCDALHVCCVVVRCKVRSCYTNGSLDTLKIGPEVGCVLTQFLYVLACTKSFNFHYCLAGLSP